MTIKLTHFFHGSATGRVTHHRVTSARGVARIYDRYSRDNDGHGVRIELGADTLRALGGYRSIYQDDMLPVAGRDPLPVFVGL